MYTVNTDINDFNDACWQQEMVTIHDQILYFYDYCETDISKLGYLCIIIVKLQF